MMNDEASENASAVRRSALRQLLRIENQGAFVGLGIGGDAVDGDAREVRQTTEYVSGVTRWRRRLDYILQQFYRGELEKMEPALKQILRIGLYDIVFLNTPEYAAVNDAVNLAKKEVRSGAGGLVNGVLRSVLRQKDALPEPATEDDADDLAIIHSHPTWIVRRWLGRYGRDETIRLLEWNNQRPIYAVRANTMKITAAELRSRLEELEVAFEPGRYLSDVFRLRSIQPLLREGFFADGLCAVQDEGAGLVVRLLDPAPGERILDACAAPGGKAFLAAELMQDRGEVVAIDVHERRLHLVERGAEELGLKSISTVASDVRSYRPQSHFDRVLLDAPCSGFGVLSKRADLRWNRRPEDFAELRALQDELLDAAAACVRPGGVLVYATCTIEPEENQQRVRAFLESHADFEVENAAEYVPRDLVSKDGFYSTLPFRDGVDGAFGARLRKGK